MKSGLKMKIADKERKHEHSPNGSLLMMDFWGCDGGILNCQEFLLKHSVIAAKVAGMRVMANLIIPFTPQGISLVLILSESHLTIHTSPEFGYAGIDIFTCGRGNPEIACEYLTGALKPQYVISKRFSRGILQSSIEANSGNKKEVKIYAER
jgi:S-adenosylmethionine decarboxylase